MIGPVAAVFEQGGPRRLRVLAICAAPASDEAPLAIDREWAALRGIAESQRAQITLVRLVPPTREALRAALRSCCERGVAPHVLHFAGHGRPDRLVLEDPVGREDHVSRAALSELLRDGGVRLVVLNACYSATYRTVSLARWFVRQGLVDTAIGHEAPILDEVAIAFAGSFYSLPFPRGG